MSNIKNYLRLHFLCLMYAQDDNNGRFWEEDATKTVPGLRTVHLDEGEVAHLLRTE